MRNLTRIAVLCALALAGCEDNGGAALKVVVGSDFAPLTEVRVRMLTPGGDLIEEALFDVAYEGLPFSFSVVPPDPEDAPHTILRFEAVGADYMTAFEREVQFSGQVFEGQTLFVYLAAQCETLACEAGKTCSELGCVDPWVADADMGQVKDGAELEGLDCEPGQSWCRDGGAAVEKCGAFGRGREYIECASHEVCGGTPAACIVDDSQNNNNNNNNNQAKVVLHVEVGGGGYGAVVSADRTLWCDGQCTFEVLRGSDLQLLPEAGGNDYFVGWSQGCWGSGDCWLNPLDEVWVGARFEANGTVVFHRLDVAMQGNGAGRVYDEGGTIDCGGGHTTCFADVSHGTQLRMIAEPDSASIFLGWEGICWGIGDPTCDLTVDAPTTLMPRFVSRPTGPARFDVDGDGFGDLVYAAPGAPNDAGNPSAGRVYMRKGPIVEPNTFAGDAEYRWDGGTTNEELGRALVVADVSNDGVDDVVIGAPGNQSKKGAVYAIFGGPGLIHSQSLRNHAEVIYGQRAGELFGAALTARPDLDGDRRPDLVVGAPGDETMPGRVYVFLSGSLAQSGSPQPSLVITGEQPGDRFGWSVESAGDLDGDGTDELLVGAPRFSLTGLPEAGRAYLFKFDTSLSQATEADGIVTGAQPHGMLGFAVTGLGDWQGDASREWAVSMHVHDQVLVFSGFTTRQHVTPVAADYRVMGAGFFGAALGGFEDYDGDGRPDLVVGAPIAEPGSQGASGQVRVYVGGGPVSAPALQVDGSSMALHECSDEGVGYTVGPIGDLDLDGTPELGVGSRYGGGASGARARGRLLVYDLDVSGRPVNLGSYDARWLVEGEDHDGGMCASLNGGHAYWPAAAEPSLP